ncbi:CT392 family protein [Chlamydia vaughanii]|uniref:CT392 family protein n=1 Tax=Chlamydia vaughanii TaxID=3112552 RepID=UPI0032B2B697
MSSVSGSSGVGPSPKPIPDNSNHGDGVAGNQAGNSGTTELGARVEVGSLGGISPSDSVGNQAVLVDAAVAPQLDAGVSVVPASPDTTAGAAAIALEAVAAAAKPSVETLGQEMTLTAENVTALVASVLDATMMLDSYKIRVSDAKVADETSPPRTREEVYIRAQELETLRQQLTVGLEGLSEKSAYLTSQLADLHKQVLGKRKEELADIFGESVNNVVWSLSSMGLDYTNEEWRINGQGSIPVFANKLNEFTSSLKSIHIPSISDLDNASAPDAEVSCCEALLNRIQSFFDTLAWRFQTLYNRVLYCLFWVIKRVRDGFRSSDSEIGTGDDPHGYGGDTRL